VEVPIAESICFDCLCGSVRNYVLMRSSRCSKSCK
jgi:hypothetical protein